MDLPPHIPGLKAELRKSVHPAECDVKKILACVAVCFTMALTLAKGVDRVYPKFEKSELYLWYNQYLVGGIVMRVKLAVVAALGILVPTVPVLAHHSFAAEYDASKPVTLKGTVTKVEWTNPHARFYVAVKDDAGNVTNWNLELASPNVLSRNGWTRHSLNEGDQITVEGSKAKDGSNLANARVVTLASGKKVFAGSSQTDGQ
jgi:hypothetical protein